MDGVIKSMLTATISETRFVASGNAFASFDGVHCVSNAIS